MRASEQVTRILSEAEAAWCRLPPRYQEEGAAWTRADPYVVAHELRLVAGRNRRFLEWGSGIGTHCLIADALGMEAHGIEIDAALVKSAGELAARLSARTVFAEGTFIPANVPLPTVDEDGELLFGGGPNGYTALIKASAAAGDPVGQDGFVRQASGAAAYDVIYAYPAPQHIDWFADLFRDVAHVGAVFWCYTETAGILTSTKTGAHAITPLRPA